MKRTSSKRLARPRRGANAGSPILAAGKATVNSMNVSKICKGVKLGYHQTNKFKTTAMSINIVSPLDSHTSEKALLIYLLSRTNKANSTVFEMNRTLAKLYGAIISASVSKSGESLVLSLNLTCLDDRFTLGKDENVESCIKLLFSCLFEPDITPDGFKKENVEREKRLLVQRLESERDDKRIYSLNRMIEEMCKNEAYSLNKFGTKEAIEKATGKSIFDEWKKLLFSCPVQVNYIGPKDEKEIADIIKPYFEKLERKSIIDITTEFLTEAYTPKTVKEKQNVKQGKLVIGYRAGMTYNMDNYAAIKVMTAIFGSGTFSKLFMNVREKMSLCYYCSASLINSKGIIVVQSGVETENAQKALDAITHELEEVKKGNFADETIEQAKLSLCDSLNSVVDNADQIDSWFKSYCAWGEFFSPEKIASDIQNVSREEIIVAAGMVTRDTVFVLESKTEDNGNE